MGKEGDANFPMEKKFLSEAKSGVVNQTWWPYEFAGSTRNAGAELKAISKSSKLSALSTRSVDLLIFVHVRGSRSRTSRWVP